MIRYPQRVGCGRLTALYSPVGNAGPRRREGQALIESCLVVAMVCVLFFGIFQVSQLFAAQEVLSYAAGRAARARTVGFNRFMVFKTIRVGTIPNAGRLVNPLYEGGPAESYALESARIPLYLGAEDYGRLRPILDYADWNTIRGGVSSSVGDGTMREEVSQTVPLRYPFHRPFYAADSVEMRGETTLDEHYTLYLDDAGW